MGHNSRIAILFVYTFIYNDMKINKVKKCILFDTELLELWSILKKHKINTQSILRQSAKKAFKEKIKEMGIIIDKTDSLF